MSTTLDRTANPRRYFETVSARSPQAETKPVCLYLEVTNRCNLLCETCPRTFEALEPPADMSMDMFRSHRRPGAELQRAVLHGVGEPMLVRELPDMIRYLKARGVYVLFNTNGTLLREKRFSQLIDIRPRRTACFARCRRRQDLRDGTRKTIL